MGIMMPLAALINTEYSRIDVMQIQNFKIAILGALLSFVSTSSWAWSVTESFDNQSIGANCGTFWADPKDSTVTSAESASGNNSCKFANRTGNFGWGGGFKLPSVMRKGDEGWVRFRLYMPNGFDYSATSGGRLKFIRWTTKNSGGGNAGYMDWYWNAPGMVPPFQVIREFDTCSTNCWQKFGTASDAPVQGRWETYEMYIKLDDKAVDQGGTGRVRVWKNGKLMGDLTNRPTLPNDANDTVVSIKIFSYWNGGSPKNQFLYFDDLVATNVNPGSFDSQGNRYIGVGNFVAPAAVAPPMPPLVN